MIGRGTPVRMAHFLEHGKEAAALSLRNAGAGISPHPHALSFPQDDHERFLVDRLASRGVAVEWETALHGFEDCGDHLRATLRGEGAGACEAAYLCGCDGAHSTVRQQLGLGFPGGTYGQLFHVADVAVAGPPTTDLFAQLGERSLALMLPVRSRSACCSIHLDSSSS